MGLPAFLLTIVGISLSGVMAPGPITAATLAAAARRRHAGAWICAGHAAVELPLILVLAGGLGAILASPGVRAAIGLVGGLVLVWMAVQLLLDLRRSRRAAAPGADRHPLWIGVALSGANPYFLLWWATVGLALTGQALQFGIVALVLFILLHWACDLAWLELLSLVGHKGAALGRSAQTAISVVCAAMLLGFGAMFVWDAASEMKSLARSPEAAQLEVPSRAGEPIFRQTARDRSPNGPPRAGAAGNEAWAGGDQSKEHDRMDAESLSRAGEPPRGDAPAWAPCVASLDRFSAGELRAIGRALESDGGNAVGESSRAGRRHC